MGNRLKSRKGSGATVSMLLVLLVVTVITLLPFISIFLASFRPGREIMRQGLGLNLNFSQMNLDNYKLLFSGDNQDYFSYFKNSLKLTFLQTALTLLFSSFVAYGFAMYNFRGKTLLFGLVLLMMTTPVEILMLPLFLEMQKLRLYGSLWAVILPQITAPLPVFFFRQYLVGLPRDYLDAARVDGCTEYGIFFRIIMPLMKPSFAAMGIFVGMNSWNSFILPVLLLSKENRTLPVFLETLLSPYKNNYDLLIVGAVFSVIPIVILFALFQRHFIAGMTAGGVKG
ncbi:MAG: carbohydrate ABC transporter permease [Oscillospiraceae bacterium]|nr:carbohydrate ABC transporter permease [Oscillospiraceae bacterium]